ncbi:MAG: helix-turn-helix domain-containing protein [Myxococcota bacterium]|nr:helix-turn-helix domain-containing protein [Myxococcota bacterium]
MPANRPDRSRDEKSGELLAIALRLFLERGYAGTTMAAIAAEGGVASNVVHWYFASKDELFAAALDSLQVGALDALEQRFDASRAADHPKRLASLLVEMTQRAVAAHSLIGTVHERASRSAPIAALHERAHERYEAFLRRLLARSGARDEDLEITASALMSAMEGLVVHQATKAESERMLSFLVERLLQAHETEGGAR